MIPCVNSELSLIQINRDDSNVAENNFFSLNNNEATRRAFASAVNLIRPEVIFVKHFFDNQNQYIPREFFNFNHEDRIVPVNRRLCLESSWKSVSKLSSTLFLAEKTNLSKFFNISSNSISRNFIEIENENNNFQSPIIYQMDPAV